MRTFEAARLLPCGQSIPSARLGWLLQTRARIVVQSWNPAVETAEFPKDGVISPGTPRYRAQETARRGATRRFLHAWNYTRSEPRATPRFTGPTPAKLKQAKQ